MRPYVNYFAGYYIFSYAAIGALFPLIAQYLHGIGFSGGQIGVITASSTASILSNFWGGIYHRSERSKTDLVALCYNCPVIADDVGGKFLDILTIIYLFSENSYLR